LANGASMTHSTETSYAGFGVQCEQCHGTGVADATDHHGTGVRVVRTKQALKSQVCGQCHGTGTAKELNYNGTTFSGPNGYTPDKKLEDFFNITDVQYVRTSAASGPVTIPATDTKFYPDGHNKAARYAYYNEWLFSGHANSLRFRGGTKWTSNPRDTCLGCHSGEGFLKRIGYGGGEPNDISSQASSVASDTLNVECGICHVVHSSTTTEPLGLRLPKGQLCQACHYGRLAPGATAVAGSTLRYTQAEMLAGYGLIGVPRRDRPVMGDTDCIDCHMPETYTGRYSHRFTPMMPGDAVAWGVPAGGDSCTKCHTSVPREELQADLDAWASNIASATDDASRAIASARSRAASSSVVGKLLLDSASTNMTFIKADLSQGAHDYPYAKAGLDKSAYFADAVGASFARCTATSYNGATGLAFVYGQLVFGDGSVRADELVTIEAQPVGSTLWAVVDSVRTTARGEFYCAVAPSATTSYRVRWTPLDGAAFLSPVLSVSLTPSTSSTSIAASARSVPLGRYVTISSLVAPPRPGATVQIQYRYGSDSWRSLPAQALDSAGAYRCLFRAPARGTVSFRAVFAGDAIETGSTSGVVSVRVY
jgi:predicted CXXCH cytochrome family protein